jgi:hypothetical protein
MIHRPDPQDHKEARRLSIGEETHFRDFQRPSEQSLDPFQIARTTTVMKTCHVLPALVRKPEDNVGRLNAVAEENIILINPLPSGVVVCVLTLNLPVFQESELVDLLVIDSKEDPNGANERVILC